MRGWHRSSWQSPWAHTLTTPRKAGTWSSRNIPRWEPWTSVALQSCCRNKISLQLWFNHVLPSTDICDYPKPSLRNVSAPPREHLFHRVACLLSRSSGGYPVTISTARAAKRWTPRRSLGSAVLLGHEQCRWLLQDPFLYLSLLHLHVPTWRYTRYNFSMWKFINCAPLWRVLLAEVILQLTKPCPWLSFRIWLLFHIYLKQSGWQITAK